MNKQQIIKAKKYISLLEKHTGKKVYLKEVDEAGKNTAVNNLQFISTSIANSIDKISELSELPIMSEEYFSSKVNTISKVLTKLTDVIDDLISSTTNIKSDEQTDIIDEDVSMSTDDIIKNPTIVKKLADKKIDVKVKDKNMQSSIIQ